MTDQKHPHFIRLLELLRQEKEADLQSFLDLVREKPLAERVAEGYTWYPLNVVQTGFALGEKAFVVVERTTRLNEPHQLRAGQSVSLFTRAEHAEQSEKQGVINYVERNRMKIILNARDVPDWINLGLIGVDMLFDDRSYREMERALENVMAAKGDRLSELRRLAAPPSPPMREGGRAAGPDNTWPAADIPSNSDKHRIAAPRLTTGPAYPPGMDTGSPHLHTSQNAPLPPSWGREGLNPSQQNAVRAILENRDLVVIHGPPGTGKTTTLVAAIQSLVQTENTVLVTAPSNTAADVLTERLAGQGVNVVRIGNISRVDDNVLRHTLDALLTQHPESKNIKKVKIQAAEYRRQARRYKRSFGAAERREREHLKTQARELEAWANTLENRLIDQILTSAQAITCTLVGAAHPLLERRKFRTIIIDEAAQALEPACWIPIAKGSRVVLAGDPFQLPPTVKNLDAARNGLSITLIERCLDILPDRVHLLTVQYRMHRAIMDFSNQYFYGGALQAHESVQERGLSETASEPAVVFIDTAGCGFEERLQESGESRHQALSRFNPDEASLVREHLLQLLHRLTGEHHFTPGNEGNSSTETLLPDIGILSPYREQVNTLEQLFRDDPQLAHLFGAPKNGIAGVVTINTIDGFQGQERDVIYISLVRSNPKHEIGFLQDYRRMNVAMTRARKLLVVIGDSATIGQNKFYQAFLDYCAGHGAYQTAWEYLHG